jgi:serine protease Do
LMIGEPVIAVGNPMGYSHSVSTGIVSAIHRDLKDPDERVMLGDLVQTDAAINPGNSGGPLLNAYGQVIGINTAIRGDAQNIGFAIQVNRLRDLIPELMNPAQVSKVDLPVKLVERRSITPPANVSCEIIEGKGDAKAGGRNGRSSQRNESNGNNSDRAPAVLRSIDGQRPRDIIDAYAMLLRVKVGQPLEIAWDDGTQKVTAQGVPQPDAIVQAKRLFGISIEPLTPMLAEKYRLAVEDGLFITQVGRNTPAAKAGIQAGDVLVQMGRYRVANLDDFAALLHRLPDSGRVRMLVQRGERVGYAIVDF